MLSQLVTLSKLLFERIVCGMEPGFGGGRTEAGRH